MGSEGLQKRISPRSGIAYYLYEPPHGAPQARTFVTVHGWSRNAKEHARRFLPFAETHRFVLVAPLFDRRRFPDYQRLGPGERHGRADRALNGILEEVARSTARGVEPVFLFGYSGGGQFAQRFAMAHPERVARLALGAPGWYTFPDPARSFPLGIGPSPRLQDVRFEPRLFLRIPVAVLVGELDRRRDSTLNKSSLIDRMQGINRQERARRWVLAMKAAARALNLSTQYVFELLPGAGHSFRRCMVEGGMGARVFGFLLR
jgi:pimeloyl-ACP methyl ester carboxylesterase